MSNYESKPPSIGLWKSDSDRGPLMAGTSGGIRFVVWPNDKRGNDKAPDARLVMEATQRKEDKSPVDKYTDHSKGGEVDDVEQDSIPF